MNERLLQLERQLREIEARVRAMQLGLAALGHDCPRVADYLACERARAA